jgi:hypothetical protein
MYNVKKNVVRGDIVKQSTTGGHLTCVSYWGPIKNKAVKQTKSKENKRAFF